MNYLRKFLSASEVVGVKTSADLRLAAFSLGVFLIAVPGPLLAQTPSSAPSAASPNSKAQVDATDKMVQDLNTTLADILKMGSAASLGQNGKDVVGEMARDAGINPLDPLGSPLPSPEAKGTAGNPQSDKGSAGAEQDPTQFLQDFSKEANGLVKNGLGMYGKLLQAEIGEEAQSGQRGQKLLNGRDKASEPKESGIAHQRAVELVGQGNLKALAGETGLAEDLFSKALLADPEYGEAYYGLATVAAKQDKVEVAASALSRAIALDPKYLERAKRDSSFSALMASGKLTIAAP